MNTISKTNQAKPAARRGSLLLVGLWILLGALLLGGCGKKVKGTPFQIYYMNMEQTSIRGEEHVISTEELNSQQLAETLMDYLMQEPEDPKLLRTISSAIACNSVSVNGYLVTVDMPESFLQVSDAEDVLIRGAIVKTLTQIQDVVYINFHIDGAPMIGRDGKLISKMGAEDFVENPEDAIHKVQRTTLDLYFADPTGTYLKEVHRTVSYSSNTSLERLIMKQLIAGVSLEGFRSTIPPLTRLISISVMDKVCYVNLDEAFLNDQNSEITEQVILYSIVNSLTELPEVDKVQIAINGATDGTIRYLYNLSEMYERNDDLLIVPVGIPAEETTTEAGTEN